MKPIRHGVRVYPGGRDIEITAPNREWLDWASKTLDAQAERDREQDRKTRLAAAQADWVEEQLEQARNDGADEEAVAALRDELVNKLERRQW